MFGKAFALMYEGSMYGSGPVVFALWGYMIANSDGDGHVELNTKRVADTIGTTVEEIENALKFLASPDEKSRNPEEEGRRIVAIGPFHWRLVSFRKYRDLKNQEQKRDYMRGYMRERRAGERSEQEESDDLAEMNHDELVALASEAVKNPFEARFKSPERWPAVIAAAQALHEGLGLKGTAKLGQLMRDPGTMRILELFAAGFTVEEIRQAAKGLSAWVAACKTRPGLSNMSPEVIRRALAAAVAVENPGSAPLDIDALVRADNARLAAAKGKRK